tara:strand:- start:226 stop:612 length:387 start_codon:yes stop_codon:yes gene_type:complete
MAERKFNDITYPVPGQDTAVQILRPGASFSLGEDGYGSDGYACRIIKDPENREPPTKQEVEDEIAREIRIWDHYSYERDRSDNFPLWFDQLDMLYHDIKNGNLENGKWIQAIDAVKESFPKPEGPVPE